MPRDRSASRVELVDVLPIADPKVTLTSIRDIASMMLDKHGADDRFELAIMSQTIAGMAVSLRRHYEGRS